MATQRRAAGRGLINNGNTCYLNSVVQSLNAFPLFLKYLRALKVQGHSHPLLNALQSTVDELGKLGDTPFRPSLIYDTSVQKHFKPGEQQDAHEFLTFLLDEICTPGSGTTPVTAAKQNGLSVLFQTSARLSGLTYRANPTTPDTISLTQSMSASPLYSTLPMNGQRETEPIRPLSPVSLPDPTLKSNGNHSNSNSNSYNHTRIAQGNVLLGNQFGSTPSHDSSLNGTPGRSSHTYMSPIKAPTGPDRPMSPPNTLNGSRSNLLASGRATGLASSRNAASDAFSVSSSYLSSPFAGLGASSYLSPTALAKSKKVLPSPFMGKMESTIRCKTCRSQWSMIQPMTMISAFIPQSVPSPTLDNCMVTFTKSEDVKGVYCQKCKTHRVVEKRLSVAKEPELLCIFINRLKYDKGPGGALAARKLDAHVKFDLEFNLGTATSQLTLRSPEEKRTDSILSELTDSASALSGNYGLGGTNGSTTTASLSTTSPRRHMTSGRNTPSEASSVASTSSQFIETSHPRLTLLHDHDYRDAHFDYQLIAVIVHLGNQSGGHYVCYRAINPEDPESANWLYISDGIMSEVPLKEVLRQHAYMLFYKKKFTTMDSHYDDIMATHEDSALPMAFPQLHRPTPALASTALPSKDSTSNGLDELNGLSSSHGLSSSSSSLPTSSPESESIEEGVRSSNKLFLEPEDSSSVEQDSHDGLRSAFGIPSELIERPMASIEPRNSFFDELVAGVQVTPLAEPPSATLAQE